MIVVWMKKYPKLANVKAILKRISDVTQDSSHRLHNLYFYFTNFKGKRKNKFGKILYKPKSTTTK